VVATVSASADILLVLLVLHGDVGKTTRLAASTGFGRVSGAAGRSRRPATAQAGRVCPREEQRCRLAKSGYLKEQDVQQHVNKAAISKVSSFPRYNNSTT
jgi:hypothetical protein